MLPLPVHLFSSLIPFETFQMLGKVDSNRNRRCEWVSERVCEVENDFSSLEASK